MYASQLPGTIGAEQASADAPPAEVVPAALEPANDDAPPAPGPAPALGWPAMPAAEDAPSLSALPPHAAITAASPENSTNPANRLLISGSVANRKRAETGALQAAIDLTQYRHMYPARKA